MGFGEQLSFTKVDQDPDRKVFGQMPDCRL